MRGWGRRLGHWAVMDPDRAVLAGIVAATLARLAYVSVLGDRPGGPDFNAYHGGGRDFARHGLLSDDVQGQPFWAPGYPMLVAAHYALVGEHPYAVALTQTAMVAGLTWLTYCLAKRVVGQPAALVTGLGTSASLAWLALPHPLMYEPWLALFFVGALLALLRFEDEGGHKLLVVAGLLVGLACAFQNKVLSLVPLVAVWVAWSRRDARLRRRRLAACGLFVAGVLVVVVPLVVRNQLVYDEPVLIATKNGANVLYGNNRDADGSMANQPVRDLPWCPGVDVFDREELVATDRKLFACAVREALAHPVHELRILPNKFARLWLTYVGPWQPPGNWRHQLDVRKLLPGSVRRASWFRPADLVASSAWVAGGLALAAAGAVLLVRRQGGRVGGLVLLPVGWLIAAHLATFGDPRFRIPVLPLVWLLQATALAALVKAWTGRRRPER